MESKLELKLIEDNENGIKFRFSGNRCVFTINKPGYFGYNVWSKLVTDPDYGVYFGGVTFIKLCRTHDHLVVSTGRWIDGPDDEGTTATVFDIEECRHAFRQAEQELINRNYEDEIIYN